MSFADLKRKRKNSFSTLAEKMNKENKGGGFKDDRFYQPVIDANGNGFAIVRFLPAPEGEESPYVKTFSHGFKVGGKWYIEECPTTIGKKCPACEANSVLWETGTQKNQDIVRQRKRRTGYIANILIVSDPKQPELEGKVFLYKFGQKIFAKLMSAINPEFEDEVSFNPFDLWEGANFKIKIRNYEGFRNYDKCEFAESAPLFEDDDQLEKVWKCEYALSEFLDDKNFKSYEDLKAKLDGVIGADKNTKAFQETAKKPAPKEDDNDPPFEPDAAQEEVKKEVKDVGSAGSDEDFELFQSLIDD